MTEKIRVMPHWHFSITTHYRSKPDSPPVEFTLMEVSVGMAERRVDAEITERLAVRGVRGVTVVARLQGATIFSYITKSQYK